MLQQFDRCGLKGGGKEADIVTIDYPGSCLFGLISLYKTFLLETITLQGSVDLVFV